MSQDSSFATMFDLESQGGVMAVLAGIRASTLSASEKNELRDLVFLYTNGGHEPSVKISLEQKLTAYKIAVVQKAAPTPKAPVLPFGSYRPTPTFRPPASVPQATPKPVSVASPVIPPTPPAQSTPTVIPTAPPTAPVQTATNPTPTPPPTPTPTPTPVPVVEAAPAAVASVLPKEADYLERIRQIKTAVNSKVGNPVNLVDIDNGAGREYMNALLEAMKKLSSGAVSEMEPAMARLETAYSAVELAIKNHGEVSKINNTPAPVSTPAPAAPSPKIVDLPRVEVSPTPRPIVSEPVVDFRIPVSSPVDRAEVPSAVEERPTVPLQDLPSSIPTPSFPRVQKIDVEPRGFAAAPPQAPSLADASRMLTPNDLPESSSLEVGDALYTKEVEDGLEQLLADWTLFKKSGLFGTGPKGREHPLFKKVAPLQIPLLLAGRFEGATPEIRQSISDYMNGWRYEQGIIYETGETFEKYLRRVIRHILDLQKKRK